MEDFVHLNKAFENVSFNNHKHLYKINNKEATCSVTQLIKRFEKPFDEEKISKIVAARDGVSCEDVKGLWKFKRDFAAAKGTHLHFYAENFLQRKQVALDKTAIKQFVWENIDYITEDKFYEDVALHIKFFLDFYEWWKRDHILIASEFVVGDSATGLCGCIDNLSYNYKTKELVIFDYKTNQDIKQETKKCDKMLNPISHLTANNQTKYSIQQDLYSLIIERNTKFKIPSSYIVWTSPNGYELFLSQTKDEAKILLKTLEV